MLINITASEKMKIKALAQQDAWLHGFLTANYSEIDGFVDANITNLTSARRLFKIILKILLFLFRRSL